MRIEIHLCISLDMSGRENFYILLYKHYPADENFFIFILLDMSGNDLYFEGMSD